MLTFGGPDRVIQAEYWVGNKSVAVRTVENGFIATFTNLHGVVLWWETNRHRLAGLAIFGVSVAATVAIATSQLQG
jgi:hypothetical protein